MKNSLRDDILQKVLSTKKNNIVLEVATGVGKTRLALEKLHQLYLIDYKILIVIPRNVLIQNWKDEFIKWGYADMLDNIVFTTYVSLPKYAGRWDVVIFDEAHHISERCQEALKSFNITHCLFLSATLKKEHKWFISQFCHHNIEYVRITTKKAIDNEVLPDPKILLIPLELNKVTANCFYYPKKIPINFHGAIKNVPYKDRWTYKRSKIPYRLQCTEWQYYMELSSLIEWYRNKNYNPAMRNIWLHKCGERLQWLSSIKLDYTKQIISTLSNRYVVFCNTIEESEKLGVPPINSKVGIENLEEFNSGNIDEIAAVNMLNEGMNLVNCQIGIFNSINASELMQVQKVGRLLRHKNPFIIIPYFKATREEEIVDKWMEGYNPQLIHKLDNINNLKEINMMV